MTLIVMKTLERVYKNYYYIIRGDEIYLSNYVKESGYNYAAIKTLSDHQVPYTIKFWWSPDSI